MDAHRCCGLYPEIDKSETASAVVIFNLPELCDERVALLIHNTEEVRGKEKGGGVKPANWGVPGGGIKPGEEPGAAVLRELRQETGISSATAGSAERVFFRHSFMFNENNEGRKPAYEKCRDVVEAIRVGRVEEREMIHQSLNWAFLVRCEWQERLSEIFNLRRLSLSLGAESTPEEKEYGALVVLLDNEMAEKLDIVEAFEGPSGRREIDAIGIFPLSQIEFIRDTGTPGFSRSHLGYIANGAKRHTP